MKMTTSWAFASAAVVAILVAGCTTETADNSEGGVTTGTAGGSAAGAAGSGGGSSTGGSGGTGGSSSDTDSGGEVMTPCETCAYAKCKMTQDACEADPGCKGSEDDFIKCLAMPGSDEASCAGDFAKNANGADSGGATQANDLATCIITESDCLPICQGGTGAGDAGTHE